MAITTRYGVLDRSHPTRPHGGTDISAPRGTPIPAAEGGIVTRNNFDKGGYGNRLAIQKQNGDTDHYGHLDQPSHLPIGSQVNEGDHIGNVGSTGRSTGPHLHYETRKPGDGKEHRKEPNQENVQKLNRALNPHEYPSEQPKAKPSSK